MATSPARNLLVLVDGTESGARAAQFAVDLAAGLRASLTALSVVDTDTPRKLMSARILVQQEVADFEAEMEKSQRRHLDAVMNLAQKAGLETEAALTKGVIHSAVLAEQKARGCDMIVIGGFRTTLAKMDLMARERQTIVDEAPCPVLVVK